MRCRPADKAPSTASLPVQPAPSAALSALAARTLTRNRSSLARQAAQDQRSALPTPHAGSKRPLGAPVPASSPAQPGQSLPAASAELNGKSPANNASSEQALSVADAADGQLQLGQSSNPASTGPDSRGSLQQAPDTQGRSTSSSPASAAGAASEPDPSDKQLLVGHAGSHAGSAWQPEQSSSGAPEDLSGRDPSQQSDLRRAPAEAALLPAQAAALGAQSGPELAEAAPAEAASQPEADRSPSRAARRSSSGIPGQRRVSAGPSSTTKPPWVGPGVDAGENTLASDAEVEDLEASLARLEQQLQADDSPAAGLSRGRAGKAPTQNSGSKDSGVSQREVLAPKGDASSLPGGKAAGLSGLAGDDTARHLAGANAGQPSSLPTGPAPGTSAAMGDDTARSPAPGSAPQQQQQRGLESMESEAAAPQQDDLENRTRNGAHSRQGDKAER